MKKNILVFDVESTSLFGSAFAVGAIVMNDQGIEIDQFELKSKEGENLASDWVKGNVIHNLQSMSVCETDRELRDAFYSFYMKHKETCEIWSDCNFPVETNFLNAVANDDLKNREFSMPFPLKDISTIVDVNIDRAVESGITELKKHNPLDDARASAYFLIKKSVEIKPPNKIINNGKKSIFIAGTIDDNASFDWQRELTKKLIESDLNINILNPRRDNWGDLEQNKLVDQVNWELNALDECDFILMNFLPDSKSPITLLELGLYASSGKLIVCCPTEFYRSGNVHTVCHRYNIPLFLNINATTNYLLKKLE